MQCCGQGEHSDGGGVACMTCTASGAPLDVVCWGGVVGFTAPRALSHTHASRDHFAQVGAPRARQGLSWCTAGRQASWPSCPYYNGHQRGLSSGSYNGSSKEAGRRWAGLHCLADAALLDTIW